MPRGKPAYVRPPRRSGVRDARGAVRAGGSASAGTAPAARVCAAVIAFVTVLTAACGRGGSPSGGPYAGNLTLRQVKVRASDLGPGWVLEREVELTPSRAEKGSRVEDLFVAFDAERILNQFFSRQGVTLQVNLVQFGSTGDAEDAVEMMETSAEGNLFGVKKNIAVEIISGDEPSRALAARAVGIERGPSPSGKRKKYKVEFQLACVDNIDYMKSNELSNYLQDYREGRPVDPGMQAVIGSTVFGNSVCLLVDGGECLSAEYSLRPEATGVSAGDPSSLFMFDPDRLKRRAGVPYVSVEGELSVGSSSLDGGDGSVLGAEQRRRYLAETPFWPVSSPEVQALAGQLSLPAQAGGIATPAQKVESIWRWVRDNIDYRGPRGSRWGTMQVLARGYGRCWDKSDVFVTLCRAAGVPAREVAGWLSDASAGHVWAQVHLDGEGWIGVDTTGDRVGTSGDYLPFFATADGNMPILYVKMPQVEAR